MLIANSRRNKLLLSCSSRLYPTVSISVQLTRVKILWNVMRYSLKYISVLRIFRGNVVHTDMSGRMTIREA